MNNICEKLEELASDPNHCQDTLTKLMRQDLLPKKESYAFFNRMAELGWISDALAFMELSCAKALEFVRAFINDPLGRRLEA